MICELCEEKIGPKDDCVSIRTRGLKGMRYFHASCYDSVWEKAKTLVLQGQKRFAKKLKTWKEQVNG